MHIQPLPRSGRPRVGIPDGLVVTAVAEDGTAEAPEDPTRWVASVQWHPEAQELPAEERLAPFRAFVEVCRSPPMGRTALLS